MSDLLRRAAAYYDTSYPPDIINPAPPPAPTLTSLAPSSIVVDTPTQVTLTGTDFDAGGHVWADEEEQLTTYVNSTTVRYMGQGDAEGTQDVKFTDALGRSTATRVLTITATAQEDAAPEEETDQSPDAESDD